jgi:hypothetical protein
VNVHIALFADDVCTLTCTGRNRMPHGEWQINTGIRDLYLYLTAGEAHAAAKEMAKLADTLTVLEAVAAAEAAELVAGAS